MPATIAASVSATGQPFGLVVDEAEKVEAGKRISGRLWQFLLADDGTAEEALSAVALVEENPLYREVLLAMHQRLLEGGGLTETLIRYDFLFPEIFIETVRTGEWTGDLEAAFGWACQELYFYHPESPLSRLCYVAGLVQMWERRGLDFATLQDPALHGDPDAEHLIALVQLTGQTVQELMPQILRAGGFGMTVAETVARINALPDPDLPF